MIKGNSFRTEVEPNKHLSSIEYDSSVVFFGSCFANNIGEKFKQSRLNALVNPYGVIYNPYSVSNTIKSIINKRRFTASDLNYYNGLWHSFAHHSSFSDKDQDVCLTKMNDSNDLAYRCLKQANFVFVTFGTAWVYQLVDTEVVVSNCHKYPSKNFNRFILSVDEIVKIYKHLLTELFVFNPEVQVVFTVSPVRHWKDGAHGNQISKATLMLAIDSLTEQFESCSYFPAFELLMDDLRDYRFYDDDMLHPNNLAIEYIWNKFKSCFFSSKALQYQKEMIKLDKAIHHRPYDSTSESYQVFLKNQIEKIENHKTKFPNADFDIDLNYLRNKLI